MTTEDIDKVRGETAKARAIAADLRDAKVIDVQAERKLLSGWSTMYVGADNLRRAYRKHDAEAAVAYEELREACAELMRVLSARQKLAVQDAAIQRAALG